MSTEESASTTDSLTSQTTAKKRASAEHLAELRHSSPPINYLWQFAEQEWGETGIARLQAHFINSALIDQSRQPREINRLSMAKSKDHPPINPSRIVLKTGNPDSKGRSLYIPIDFIPDPETHSARIAMDPVELGKDSPYFDDQLNLLTIVTTALEFAAMAKVSISQAEADPGDVRWRNPERMPPTLSLTANKGQITLELFAAALDRATNGHFKLQAQAQPTSTIQRLRHVALGPTWINLS